MEEQTRFTFRLKQSVYDRIKEDADANMRSMNKQIEYILEKYLKEKEQKENR